MSKEKEKMKIYAYNSQSATLVPHDMHIIALSAVH